MKNFLTLLTLFVLTAGNSFADTALPAAVYDTEFAKVTFFENGGSKIVLPNGSLWSESSVSAFGLEASDGTKILAKKVTATKEGLSILFEDGARAEFKVLTEKGFLLFRLVKFDPKGEYSKFRTMNFPIPTDSKIASLTNTATSNDFSVSVMTAAPNVHPIGSWSTGTRVDRKGCSHQFTPCNNAKQGKFSARFTATNTENAGGYSVRGRAFDKVQDFRGYKSVRAWIYGDGNGQALKIQLGDTVGGHRDDYITIDFKGWKEVELTSPALNDLDYGKVASILFYYNGMPAKKTVECLIDDVRIVLNGQGTEKIVTMEDFESPNSQLWNFGGHVLSLETVARHGLTPIQFGIITVPEEKWTAIVPNFQTAAGIPSPRPGGVWNKVSPWIKESYFFLTNFKESEFDKALAIAKRGNFKMILLLCTWTDAHGHYNIRRAHYPDGLASLKRTFDRFNAEGYKVGLHILGASIDFPDPYLTPVPDKRLVTGATVKLAKEIDTKTDFIETAEPPAGFPATEVNRYMESGRTLWIDDELIYYDTVSMEKPYGFTKCKRGFGGTKPAVHQKDSNIRHLIRAYGYYMYDLNTDLAGIIADNFARTANALNTEMIYFDGSELLQRPSDGRDHWFYNAVLHQTFYDRLKNKNILLQASSTSPYSWHIMARTASADGHDDLRAYLEERSGGFKSYYAQNHFPLDIGWYYAYDKKATPDMYEYILTKSIAFDSSMSLQTSVEAAAAHPFIGEILDMIRIYDELRLTGRVPKEVREKMEIDPALFGKKTEEERNALLDKRRDYRYINRAGQEGFQRMIYGIWQPAEPAQSNEFLFDLTVKNGKAKIGFDVQVRDEKDGQLVNPRIEINGKTLTLPITLTRGQYGFYRPNEKSAQYGTPLKEGRYFENPQNILELTNGRYQVKFLCDGIRTVPIRVRTVQIPDEFLPIPAKK